MKKFIKITCLCLALVLFAMMALASSSDEGEKKTIGSGNAGNGNAAADGNGSAAVKEKVTIEEQVLFTWNEVTVTAKEYVEDSIWGAGIKVLIENNSAKDVGIGCNAVIVNNYMITDLFSATVAAGKKSNETIYLMSSDLEAAGIENVGQIELYFHVFDGDSYMTLYDAELVTIKTSAYENMDTVPNDMGTELYNGNGIRIVGKYVEEGTFWGTAVLLYIENTSGQNVTVSCEDMSINGFMVSPAFYSNIYSGKKALDEITVFQSDLEENGITSVDEIELKFHIYNSDTYYTIVDTEPITFTAK